jgi:hypothetical protein
VLILYGPIYKITLNLINKCYQYTKFQAAVVCRLLGFDGVDYVVTDSFFGQVEGTFSYDNVECTGDESSLDECSHLDESNCTTDEGAGVICL